MSCLKFAVINLVSNEKLVGIASVDGLVVACRSVVVINICQMVVLVFDTLVVLD